MTDFEQMMKDLQKEYISELPDRIREIQSHFEVMDANLLRDDFHKLKGTGKTYGIPEISELCEVVESICLKGETLIKKVLPLSIELLHEIQKRRSKNENFALSSDTRFAQICKIENNEMHQATM
ncbi:MAG: Hpt domain-containing protein [Bdellovibrionales bacterium]|nr:Hpt domain-containing protein [Bdellovibrionales bacterium]